MVSEVRVEGGCKVVTLRSVIQVKNHFERAVNLFTYHAESGEYVKLTCLRPDAAFDVPLENVYAPPHQFYFQVKTI